MHLDYFENIDNFYPALKTLFEDLNIPVNSIVEEPARPRDILTNTFKEANPAFKLMKDVYYLGMVDDAAFEENKSRSSDQIKPDYDGLLLFGVTLKERGNGLLPTRSQLAEIIRAFNREFNYTPVVVVFRYNQYIAFANTERQKYKQEWREGEKAGKVSLLRDVKVNKPHTGHLKILQELTITRTGKKAVNSFDGLYKYWQEVFNVSVLNNEFYRELSNWYFWALKKVTFPGASLNADQNGLFQEDERVKEHNAKNLIRLLTRLLFVWFVKEKQLIPEELFETTYIKEALLKEFHPQKLGDLFDEQNKGSTYYKAVLQNLFFATLNQTMGKREFRKDKQHMNVTNLMRYESCFKDPGKFIKLVEDIVPFINGGLFECLDQPDPELKGRQGGDVIIYQDGFSDRHDNKLVVPDYIFFGTKELVDLSEDYGSKNKTCKEAPVKGLINILNSYKFTITENTPIEEDVALDPELLGRVFENLLASYNPETKTTARKQTGSFYTPREIVNYMVDESLIAYFQNKLSGDSEDADELDTDLRQLISFDNIQPFQENKIKEKIIRAIDACTILDPACGSGAFPMGILQKMVHLLHKLDPGNEKWKQRQIDKVNEAIQKAEEIEDNARSQSVVKELQEQIGDIEDSFENNELDYGRKLYLLENCIYGVDIQPIAAQISKLRFFISLMVDQKVDKTKENFGIRPLPNLETKFVAANTLIGIAKPKDQGELFDTSEVKKLEDNLKKVRHKLFTSKSPGRKRKLRNEDKVLREKIAEVLIKGGWGNKTARQLASWDPYDQNASSPFFDSEWMFDIRDGFDVVIGNPPYINANELKKRLGKIDYVLLKSGFESAKGTIDIYILFFEFGLKSLSKVGHLIYISPNRYLSASYGEALRNFIYEGYSIISISDFSSVRVFEAASTYPIVSLIGKRQRGKAISVKQFNSNYEVSNEWKNQVSDLSLFPGKIWGFLLNSKIDIVKKIISESQPLSTSGIINATSTAKEADEYHELINETTGQKLINTGTIDRFLPLWGINHLTDKGSVFLKPFLDIKNSTVSESRKKLYQSPKIILAKIGIRAEAFFDLNGEFASVNTNCIHSFKSGFHPKYITLWVNSLLYQFLFSCFFDGLKMAGGYLLYSAPNLRSTYIKKPLKQESDAAIFLYDVQYWNLLHKIKISFDSIIDGFFFNLYFPDHMKERNIDILKFVDQDLKEVLGDNDFEQLPDEQKENVIEELHKRWSNPASEIIKRMNSFAEKSPDILKPILESK